MRRARALPLALTLLLAGCYGEPAGAYATDVGDRVTLTVQLGESLDAKPGYHTAKELRFALDGRVGDDGDVHARFLWLELDYLDNQQGIGEPVKSSVAVGPGGKPTEGDGYPRARTAILEALRDREIVYRLDARTGLVDLAGLRATFEEAVSAARELDDPAVRGLVDDVAAALADWFDETTLVPLLRAAGLAAIPADLHNKWGGDERDVPVQLPGRGWTDVRVTGVPAEAREGSPVIRLAGHGSPGLTFSGDPGPAPPEWVGEADPASISVAGETLYDAEIHHPIRGHVEVRYAFAQAVWTRRTTGFNLVIAK